MIKTIKYGPFEFPPWTDDDGYIDSANKASKSYRHREPEPLWRANSKELKDITLYICPRCFLYSSHGPSLDQHTCRIEQPPGILRYDSPDYQIYEVQSTDQSTRLWMQSLALFGKLFLETKSVCYALDGFLFYVLYDKASGLPAGFFSKEEVSWFDYNLACIIVFPPFQKRSLGNLLIAFSYYLSRQRDSTGSPEQPLSVHGQRAYVAYWCAELCRILLSKTKISSINSLADKTGIDPKDIIYALEHMNAISQHGSNPLIDCAQVAAYAESHPWRAVFDESCAS